MSGRYAVALPYETELDSMTTANLDMPIAEAATLMVDNRIGGLPVLDENEQVIGVITETDIFRAFVERERSDTARGPGK